MPDYGRDLEFGYFLTPSADDPARLISAAQELDELGFELLGAQDHPYQGGFLDTWTLLSVIAARTSRLRVFPDVTSLPLRPPAVLAKSAATLDLLSGGRVELGLGAGAFWDAIAAMGGPRRGPGEAIDALREAIEVIRLMWSDQRAARFAGKAYSLSGVHPGPKPAHNIGIWLGVYKPRGLALVGSTADGWLPTMGYLDPGKAMSEAHARIDEAADAAGRDPATIRRIYNLDGQAPAAQLVALLTELAIEYGMDGFVFGGRGTRNELARLAAEVVPAVREAVRAERAR
jgi:alkanesulfonate monooxygenase SsuD/methylene tetrahydromethanopterin reductase-like flavin-dependent oxidoreductase (luciferase family)